jgi:plastocyanin
VTDTSPATEPEQASELSDPNDETATRQRRAAGIVTTVMISLAVVALAVVGFAVFRASTHGSTRHVIDIPNGTGARIDAGENISIIPAEYKVNVGDTVVIVNGDVRLHDVGPFKVRPGETLSYRFNQIGRYSGVCSIHPSGDVAFVVV